MHSEHFGETAFTSSLTDRRARSTRHLYLLFSTVFSDVQNLHGNQGMLTSMWLDRPHSRMPAAPDRTNVASVAMHKAT